MTPSFSLATDNIYKFTCLFGLALIIVSIIALISTYTTTLDRKVKYAEVIIPLEAKVQRGKSDDDLLDFNKKLLELTKTNEKTLGTGISAVLGVGIALTLIGGFLWYSKIQLRDDKLAQLQIEKLEAEIAELRAKSTQTKMTEPLAVADQESASQGD